MMCVCPLEYCHRSKGIGHLESEVIWCLLCFSRRFFDRSLFDLLLPIIYCIWQVIRSITLVIVDILYNNVRMLFYFFYYFYRLASMVNISSTLFSILFFLNLFNLTFGYFKYTECSYNARSEILRTPFQTFRADFIFTQNSVIRVLRIRNV